MTLGDLGINFKSFDLQSFLFQLMSSHKNSIVRVKNVKLVVRFFKTINKFTCHVSFVVPNPPSRGY